MVVSKANRVAGLVLATLLVLTFAAGAHADTWQARVTNIFDGDTITVIGPAGKLEIWREPGAVPP